MSRHPGSPRPASAAPSWDGWLCALVFVAVVLAYLPALGGGFIWDDAGHVTRPDLRSLAGLGRIWCEIGATQQYYPVLHSAFWLEHGLWGDAPLGYHLLNVLLHASAACLFGTLLRRLAVPGAWFAALLFALHPVCVESVAWVSEQKNTLSMVFYLGAALAYLRFDTARRGSAYALATGLFVLALLTKTVTASLPAALLVVFWWRRGTLDWRRDVLPLLPWFVLGAASGLLTAQFERELIGAQGADFALSFLDRSVLAGRVIWFYLGKLVWPGELSFIYPHWDVDAGVWWQWLFPLGALGLLGGLAWWSRRQRGPLAALLLFAGTLFPVLGFVNVFPFLFSYVADHFQYLASLAVFALAAAGAVRLSARLPRWSALTLGAGLLVLLGGLTWSQAGMYRDVFTLYETTLRRNPTCWMAHNNLALALAESGRVEEAVPHLEAALKLRPGFAEAECNLGDDLNRLGHPAEAIPHLERALQLQPKYAEVHNNLGNALMALGRSAEGLAHFAEAIRLKPAYAVAQRNLGLALATAGRTAEALPHFERAVQLDPAFGEAEVNLAVALMLLGRLPEAVPHFEKAIALDPGSANPHNTYGRALAGAGRTEEAVAQFEAALRLNPEHAEAHMNLALALRQLGRLPEATQHYQEALRLNPRLGPNR
jgi:tetratricopeptide (TPR) repeat protein